MVEGLLEAALAYAASGWRVLPLHSVLNGVCTCLRPDCPSPGKHPLTSNGVHDASINSDDIRAWWEKWPNANVGVATGSGSGIIVIDLDGNSGELTSDRLN